MFRRRRGQVRLAIGEDEIELLKKVIGEYLELLDSGREATDPVMARLFPSASLEDPALAEDFRDLSSSDLDAHKRSTAKIAQDSLGTDLRQPLDEAQLEAWLVVLTDLRLAIGVGLGVTEEMMEELPSANDPAQWPMAVMHYLASLQESLIQALQGRPA